MGSDNVHHNSARSTNQHSAACPATCRHCCSTLLTHAASCPQQQHHGVCIFSLQCWRCAIECACRWFETHRTSTYTHHAAAGKKPTPVKQSYHQSIRSHWCCEHPKQMPTASHTQHSSQHKSNKLTGETRMMPNHQPQNKQVCCRECNRQPLAAGAAAWGVQKAICGESSAGMYSCYHSIAARLCPKTHMLTTCTPHPCKSNLLLPAVPASARCVVFSTTAIALAQFKGGSHDKQQQ